MMSLTLSEQLHRIHVSSTLNTIYCMSKVISVCLDLHDPEAFSLALSCADAIVTEAAELQSLLNPHRKENEPCTISRMTR